MGLGSAGSSPVPSIIYYNSYQYTLNHVNFTLGKKIPQTTIIHTRRSHQIVYLLYKLGCINNFYTHSRDIKKFKRSFLTFSIFFYKNSPFFKSIRTVSSPARKHTITYNALKIINQSIGSSILLLSTTQGLLTHNDAMERKIGGLILAVMN